MVTLAPVLPGRLAVARACAWAILVGGWVGVSSLSLQFAPSIGGAYALVALWLLALGVAALAGTRGAVGPRLRVASLAGAALLTAAGLHWSIRAGGLPAVLMVIIGWASLTALASGVVRSLRLARVATPAPPVAAAAAGALLAGLVLGDPGETRDLAGRLAVFVLVLAGAMAALQYRVREFGRTAGCRAGLFDCSLPAWPAGAWRDLQMWPVLLAGLAMLPMMASLPLMAQWCRSTFLPPGALVLLHLAAMFGSALLFRPWLSRCTTRSLSIACTGLLAIGALLALFGRSPWDLLGVAATHGTAWGFAWSGQLWAPTRRAERDASALRAAIGYATLTLLFGVAVDLAGASGVTLVHGALGAVAVLAWLLVIAVSRAMPARDEPRNMG